MTTPQHLYQIYIKADPDRVWQAITDPAFTSRYFHRTAIESTFEAGAGYRYVLPDGDTAAEGTVEVVEPGRRLVLTWQALYDADLAAEPASRVEWTVAPANDDATVTRVQVRHYDLGLSPKTWANVADGWRAILDGMKTLLETETVLGDVSVPEPKPADDVERDWHRALAVEANNSTWELLGPAAMNDTPTLAPEEAFDLLGRAYAAAHHWRAAAGPASINAARAAWLCSRCHATVGDGDAALRMAGLCASLTDSADGAADFDHFYAAESKARALACLGRTDEATTAHRTAEELLAGLADPEDHKIAAGDLEAGPWFGLANHHDS